MIRVKLWYKNVFFDMPGAPAWKAKLSGLGEHDNVVMDATITDAGIRDITLYGTVHPKDLMDAMNQVVEIWEKLRKEV